MPRSEKRRIDRQETSTTTRSNAHGFDIRIVSIALFTILLALTGCDQTPSTESTGAEELPTATEENATSEETAGHASLWPLLDKLHDHKFVDLTHAYDSNIPHWKGFPKEERTVLYHYDEGVGTLGSGFLAHMYCHVGQWGTHVDPPAHFSRGKRFQDELLVQEMILPLVVIDVVEKVENNPDYELQIADILAWEEQYGRVPSGAFVAMKTNWSERWPSQEAMQNIDADGVAHYPGWSVESLRFLFEERDITANGHEPTDTDPGIRTTVGDYSAEMYVLDSDHFQIELLASLEDVPAYGAIAVVTFPKPKEGSGSPARVFAIVPEKTEAN
ncbi:MAG: cyclase family protein [Acidobacteriota bacterium]